MILQQDGIVVSDQRFQARAKLPRARGSIRGQRNLAETDDYFRQDRFFKRAPGSGESRRSWRVGVADGPNIGPGTVVEKMHQHLRRGRSRTTYNLAEQISNQQLIWFQTPFASAGR